MPEVINFKRKKDLLNEEAINAIKNDVENRLQIYVSIPVEDSEDDHIVIVSNFTPGMRELYAIENLRDYLLSAMFPVEEEIE